MEGTRKEYVCKFCGKKYYRKNHLSYHEKYSCDKNLNKQKINSENIKCNFKAKTKDGGWVCKECGKTFRTKNELFDHKHKDHNLAYRNTCKICPLCGETFSVKREHMRVCKCRRHPENFHWTEEERKKMSENRRRYLKEHPENHPWKNSSKFISAPCEYLKNELKKHNINFLEEQSLRNIKENYSIDIIIPNINLGIEVNGNQHYDNKGNLKEYYQKRHDIIESAGVNLLEIHYTKVYDDNFVSLLCSNINNRLSSIQISNNLKIANDCSNYFSLKEELDKKHKLKQEVYEKAKSEGKVNSSGKIDTKMLSIHEIERRKNLILNSGVDLMKFGWVGKVVEKTGLSKRQIEKIVDKCKIKCFRRKC